MSKNSPFISDPNEYQRNINPLRDYMFDQVQHLMIMTGISQEEATEFVKEQFSEGGDFQLKKPEARFLERDFETGDREETVAPMEEYINTILRDGNIYAPTFTTYHRPEVRESPLSVFQDVNVKSRGKAKKAMFKAEQEEGPESFNYQFFSGSQTTEKLANNAVSGAMVSEHNPIHNKTGHSSLTSSCRQTSAYGNANNERFLGSNRHYWCYEVARNNIVSIVAHSNYELITQVMEKYQLHYPTADEAMRVVERSARLYWNDKRSYAKIKLLIDRLTPIQRAAYVYTGDLFQLKEYNDAFLRGFMGRLIQRVDVPDPTPGDTIHKWPEDFLNLAKQICETHTRGKSFDEMKKDPIGFPILASTTDNIAKTLWDHADLVKAFWATDNLPASIAMFPHSLRRVVLVSDTDSTIFTTQDWIHWYCGGFTFDQTHHAMAAAMIFLASQSIIHILAKMSANVGIGRKHAFTIEMKNEFRFDVFVLTQLGKHYFAQIGVKEGNVYEKYKKEIKGVHLKSSSAPKEIVQQAENMMLDIMNSVMRGERLSAKKYVMEVADLERSIIDSIRKGEFKYLKLSTVKDATAYKNGEDTKAYKDYLLWNDVFGPKYGMIAAPPYKAIQVSMELDTKGKVKNWLDNLPDQQLAQRMRDWMAFHGKDKMASMLLPLPIVSSKGIPDEIMAVADVRKTVQKATAMFYLILETLGFYFNHTELKQLVSDYY